MDGYRDGWVGWMEWILGGWMDGWMDGWIDGWMVVFGIKPLAVNCANVFSPLINLLSP